MVYAIAAICLAALIILGWRHAALTAEIKRITRYINDTDFINNNALVTVETEDKNVRALAEAVNRLISGFKENTLDLSQVEKEIRQSVTHLSHDLRTPLTSLLGYVRLLSPGLTDEQQRKYMAIIESKARTVATLAEDLFDLSILESGAYPYKPEQLDVSGLLADLLTDYVDEIERMLGAPEIALQDNTAIMGDRDMMSRIVRNLIQNALRHGAAPFWVSAGMQDGYVVIQFQNKIKPGEALDVTQLFNRFYRVDTARSSQGHGLGLSIVKKLTEAMDGQVSADIIADKLAITLRYPCHYNIMLQTY